MVNKYTYTCYRQKCGKKISVSNFKANVWTQIQGKYFPELNQEYGNKNFIPKLHKNFIFFS